MARNAAFDLVTLAAGVGTVTWRDPRQRTDGTGADAIELDYAPLYIFVFPVANNILAAGILKVEEGSVTRTGCRLISTHNGDSSQVLVLAFRELPEIFL